VTISVEITYPQEIYFYRLNIVFCTPYFLYDCFRALLKVFRSKLLFLNKKNNIKDLQGGTFYCCHYCLKQKVGKLYRQNFLLAFLLRKGISNEWWDEGTNNFLWTICIWIMRICKSQAESSVNVRPALLVDMSQRSHRKS